MFCSHCGREIDEGLRYCPFCGTPQSGIDQMSTAAQLQQPTTKLPNWERTIERPTRRRKPGKLIAICFALVAMGVIITTLILSAYFFKPPEYTGHGTDGMAGTATKVPVRSGLSDYSWEELSQIAGLIETCSNEDDAVSVAEEYNLLGEGGTYIGGTKDLTLANGRTWHMRLVGVWHDEAETASGKAGLSLLSDGIVDSRPLAYSETIPGGWEASDMEAWLSGTLWGLLPDDVATAIVPVYKMANNEGYSRSVDCVSMNAEKLWLPSTVELCGPVDWTFTTDPSNSSLYNAIINAEGEQYEAFAQDEISSTSANDSLAFGGQWWMRTLSPVKGNGRYVEADGNPLPYGSANKTRGVVVGFCL